MERSPGKPSAFRTDLGDSRLLHSAVTIAVVAVRMMQMPVHKIIDMVAMRNRGMSAIGAVPMALVVSAAGMRRRALCGIRRTDCQSVFFDNRSIHMMEVAIVQIIDVPFVNDSRVSTAGTMLMGMICVLMCHAQSPSCEVCAGAVSSSMACASAF